MELKNVLVNVHNLKKNLLFIRQLATNNQYSFEFNSHDFVVKDKDNMVPVRGLWQCNLYALKENKKVASFECYLRDYDRF